MTDSITVTLRALLVVAVATLTAACASTGAVPRPFPTAGEARTKTPGPRPAPGSSIAPGAPGDPGAPAAFDGYALTSTALSLRGSPYRNGGSDPTGFDCSGFTQYVFSRYGVALPRAVKDQFQSGTPVEATQVAAGDLLFFTTTDPGASHVGIAIDGDEFVHAPSSSGVVRVERLSQSYWSRRFIGARRVN